MTIKTIVPFGDPLLRKKAKPVEEMTPRLARLLDDMAETLYAADGRAGLAAPQVGILRRLIVMDCGDGLIELINPEIVSMRGEQVGSEGCLSFPGYVGIVKRANYVKARSANRRGETIELEGEGYLARCIQHEIDHLNGVLYIDRVLDGRLYHEETGRPYPVVEAQKLANRPF